MRSYSASRNFRSSPKSSSKSSNIKSSGTSTPESIFATEIGLEGNNYNRGSDRTQNDKKICLFNETDIKTAIERGSLDPCFYELPSTGMFNGISKAYNEKEALTKYEIIKKKSKLKNGYDIGNQQEIKIFDNIYSWNLYPSNINVKKFHNLVDLKFREKQLKQILKYPPRVGAKLMTEEEIYNRYPFLRSPSEPINWSDYIDNSPVYKAGKKTRRKRNSNIKRKKHNLFSRKRR
jgi:hypothetical protein